MFVQAVDISADCFRMAYVQLALRGIPAVVIHGNGLSDESWERAATPSLLTFEAHHGKRWLDYLSTRPEPKAAPMALLPPPLAKPRKWQLDLFDAVSP